MAEDDAGKWARARAIADEDDALRERYEDHLQQLAIDRRFAHCRPSVFIQMFETGNNDNGHPLSEFEFQALCERWCAVFGELPPMSLDPGEAPTEPDPLPADDAMLRMRDVVRIAGVSKSTIKRWLADHDNSFPRPVKLTPRRLGWKAYEVKAWRKRIEAAALASRH